jgi:hypothetical protein
VFDQINKVGSNRHLGDLRGAQAGTKHLFSLEIPWGTSHLDEEAFLVATLSSGGGLLVAVETESTTDEDNTSNDEADNETGSTTAAETTLSIFTSSFAGSF